MAKTILIIDDEPTIVFFLSDLFLDEGYDILKAYSGEEGLKLLDSKALPDLVIVDLKMPGINGKDVIQAIRQNPKFNDVPVMILTGSVKNDNDYPGEGSYQALVTKPFDIEEVLEKVTQLTTK
jgi:CheY-like chemotaxis protein